MKRYELAVEDSFSSAHQLRGYMGKCENIHGHNWKVAVRVAGERLDGTGMLVDFTLLKKMLKEVMAQLDHVNLNDINPFITINPSSENIADYICETMQQKINSCITGVNVSSVTVWESPTSSCTFYGNFTR